MTSKPNSESQPSPFDNPAFRQALRKIVDTPKEEIERGLEEEKRKRLAKRKPVKAK